MKKRGLFILRLLRPQVEKVCVMRDLVRAAPGNIVSWCILEVGLSLAVLGSLCGS